MRRGDRRLVVARTQRDEAEVDHLVDDLAGLIPVRDDVLRLEIAVGHAAGMRQRERAADRAHDLEHRNQVEPAARPQLVGEARAVQVLHHQIRLLRVADAEVEHRDDVRVAELRAGTRFAQEALTPCVGIRAGRPEHLHRHVVAKQPAARQIHVAHAAAAEAAADLVLALEVMRSQKNSLDQAGNSGLR